MATLEEEIQAGLRDAMKGATVNTEGSEFMNVTNDITPEVKAPAVDTTASSLTNETVAPIKAEPIDTTKTKTTPSGDSVATKSFEETLAERSAGKFKSWEEVEALANTPASKKFANEQIEYLNELAEKGVDVTSREFFELQSKDYESMEDPIQVRLEAMKLQPEFKGLSDRTLELKLKNEYDLESWAEKIDGKWVTKEDYDMTDEDNAALEMLLQKAELDKDFLINYKNERLLTKQSDPNEINQRAESDRQAQENWENYVEGLSKDVIKLSTKIDDKDAVEFEVSDADRKYAADMLKEMPKNINVFWNQFADEKGNIDQKKVFEAIVYLKNREAITKTAHNNALAKGREQEVKTIKNTHFEANSQPSVTTVDWREKARQQVEKNL